MELFIIILLTILGLILIIAEILFLPGLTVAGICSVISFVAAISLTYVNYGVTESFVLLGVSLFLSILTVVLCMRSKSLKAITLNTKIDSTVENNISNVLKHGDLVMAHTRLAPMGSVITENGEIFEGKSLDGYIEEKSSVQVVNIENGIAIVKRKI